MCITTGIMSDTIGLTLNATKECKAILNYCQKTVGIDIHSIIEQLNKVDVRTKTLTGLAIKRLFVDNRKIAVTYIVHIATISRTYSGYM